MVEFNTKLHQV